MKRTDGRVRKRCREVHGDKWWDTDAATKRLRQDEAIAYLRVHETKPEVATSTGAPPIVADVDIAALSATVKKAFPNADIEGIVAVDTKLTKPCYDALFQNFGNKTERRWLFHGTTQAATPNILRGGFNRSYCGKNATLYGRGVYFARDFSYSAQNTYSPPDATNVKTVIAARVLVGNIVQGSSTIVDPGCTFHTTVDSASDPAIFVVYKDYQAIPEYVIRFRLN